jgi:hypothetical protein
LGSADSDWAVFPMANLFLELCSVSASWADESPLIAPVLEASGVLAPVSRWEKKWLVHKEE